MLIVRLFDRLSPRQIGRIGFIVVAVGMVMLAFTIRNDWGTLLVILSLIVLGLGEGSLLTLATGLLIALSLGISAAPLAFVTIATAKGQGVSKERRRLPVVLVFPVRPGRRHVGLSGAAQSIAGAPVDPGSFGIWLYDQHGYPGYNAGSQP